MDFPASPVSLFLLGPLLGEICVNIIFKKQLDFQLLLIDFLIMEAFPEQDVEQRLFHTCSKVDRGSRYDWKIPNCLQVKNEFCLSILFLSDPCPIIALPCLHIGSALLQDVMLLNFAQVEVQVEVNCIGEFVKVVT